MNRPRYTNKKEVQAKKEIKLAPYGTGGRLLLTADFKVT